MAESQTAAPRAKFISVTFNRSETTKLGIFLLQDEDGDVSIREIRPSSVFAKSPLRHGDKIFQVNGRMCLSTAKNEVIDMLRQQLGTVTIVAINPAGDPNLVESVMMDDNGIASAAKPPHHQQQQQEEKAVAAPAPAPSPKISRPPPPAPPPSVVASPSSTNNRATATTTTPPPPIGSPSKSGGNIPNNGRAKFLSFTFNKQSQEMQLGLRLGRGKDGDVYITDMRLDGIVGRSLLRVGDKIFVVNETTCLSMRKSKVVELLKNATGMLTIVVINETGNPDFVESMVEKPSPDAPVGLTTRKKTKGTLEVSFVSPKGLFANSLLAVGDKVLSINGKKCEEPTEAQDFMWDAERFVSICAMTPKRLTEVGTAAEPPQDPLTSQNMNNNSNNKNHYVNGSSGGGGGGEEEPRAMSQTMSKAASQFVVSKMMEFDEEFKNLSASKRARLQELQRDDPFILSPDFKLRCLRISDFNVKRAMEVCVQEAEGVSATKAQLAI